MICQGLFKELQHICGAHESLQKHGADSEERQGCGWGWVRGEPRGESWGVSAALAGAPREGGAVSFH